ncbi:MAG: DNA primase, partial [archaeon]|nr:DNA primase [archaeon]
TPVVDEPQVEKVPAEETVEAPVEESVPVEEEPVVEETPVVDEPQVEKVPAEETVEAPVEEEPVVEEKPKKRVIRGKKTVKSEKVLTDEQNVLKDILQNVSGTRNSVLLDGEGNTLNKVEVKNLANYLKESGSSDIKSIVFDGVISQNIVDIASGLGIKTLVCKRKGKIAKLPADLTIFERSDLV